MSVDAAVTKDLMQTLEDGEKGFRQGAERLTKDDRNDLAATFLQYADQRKSFYDALQKLAKDYGDDLEESGSVAGALHRGWLTMKDALTGDDPEAVLEVAEQGEDHAVKAYEKALANDDLSPELREVVASQAVEVRSAHDAVRSLRNAHS